MSELHHLLTFPEKPITAEVYVTKLKHYLSNGIPATYTLEQVKEYELNQAKENGETVDERSEEEEETSNTTPLHILARSIPKNLTPAELSVVLELINILFEYGAGWNFIDYEDKTVGDLLIENGYSVNSSLYKRIVEAGVSAELLLRKINDNVEFLDDDEIIQEALGMEDNEIPTEENIKIVNEDATAGNQEVYLQTELEYTANTLLTKENKDGVMMDWETGIMKLASDTITSSFDKDDDSIAILNIGFGMGIIDTFIEKDLQEKYPNKKVKHYISEAHPDVLKKLKNDGWYDKKNIIILEGRWQDSLNTLLDYGNVFFDGIYYDTFSEYYENILELLDIIVGLLKPHGIFSFFNGLGADRQLCYEVYKNIVAIDVSNYGMKCEYSTIRVGDNNNQNGSEHGGDDATVNGIENTTDKPNWQNVKRSYYNCDYYYHPCITFM
ncbi:hypothetical protein TPHA_0D02720 [Tetrapisispora phaffii CBS 4417]|uniref:Arginine N-methyltransferase 2 n=1 Tax=Tetrapisispora phaffii (strain ATCC 24235 / CBS 4417 / NBRC 1672 / NRRL Y-8282 / UCD 70-5) TaxID=1071381 RepID=G8BST7_TETPH|nr:hypothetical protein TPHA_0D02720 [Tetrapisispora phaffii CBS 4417]CCE62908.1 hypothetical protein TPHA_0D02720 [Tetrapisispora phaffii CBS 4417]